MNRRKKRPNYFSLMILGLVLLFGYYFDQVYLPTQPNPFEPTPTPTRSPESFVTEAERFTPRANFCTPSTRIKPR